jgi:hypothetical protein
MLPIATSQDILLLKQVIPHEVAQDATSSKPKLDSNNRNPCTLNCAPIHKLNVQKSEEDGDKNAVEKRPSALP